MGKEGKSAGSQNDNLSREEFNSLSNSSPVSSVRADQNILMVITFTQKKKCDFSLVVQKISKYRCIQVFFINHNYS